MGKLEKVIVLSVLAVIAVILVVSLTLDDPLKKDKVVMAGASGAQPPAPDLVRKVPLDARGGTDDKTKSAAPAAAPAAQPPAQPADSAKVAAANAPAAPEKTAGAAPSTLLSTNVAPAKPDAPAIAAPATANSGIPTGSILKSSDGLQESYLADMRFYTWQSGDSFRSVAAKYYGDPAKFTILRRSNEGRDVVQPGEKILVPVFDMDAARPSDAAASAKTAHLPKDPNAPKSSAAKAPESNSASGGPRVHVVLDGESLWKIAKLELGDGGRWNEIYEANRDVLSKPEAVHAGLKLRIPAK